MVVLCFPCSGYQRFPGELRPVGRCEKCGAENTPCVEMNDAEVVAKANQVRDLAELVEAGYQVIRPFLENRAYAGFPQQRIIYVSNLRTTTIHVMMQAAEMFSRRHPKVRFSFRISDCGVVIAEFQP